MLLLTTGKKCGTSVRRSVQELPGELNQKSWSQCRFTEAEPDIEMLECFIGKELAGEE